jgi:hypothetical protein
MKPSVAIVILNWNGYEVTKDCLNSLLQVAYDNHTILVVDNGSADGSVPLLQKEFGHVPHIEILPLSRNYGFTGGNNKGIQHILSRTRPDYFLLLNNDTVVDSQFLTHMVTLAVSNASIAAVVPKIFYYDEPQILWYAGGYVNRLSCMGENNGRNQPDGPAFNTVKSVSFMNGCAMLIKTGVLEEIGFLDDLFFANCEDTDMSIRIKHAGYSIMYQPQALVWHKVSYTFRAGNQSAFGFYLATRNLIILQMRYNWGKFIFVPAIIYFLVRWVAYLQLKFLFAGKFKHMRYLHRGLIDGFTKKLRL